MGEKRFENSQTTNLQNVLASCSSIHQLLADNATEEDGKEEKKTVGVSHFNVCGTVCMPHTYVHGKGTILRSR